MSQKINFAICIETRTGSDGYKFTGAAARNVLQVLYGPEFCVVLDTSEDDIKYLLNDRDDLTISTRASVIGKDLAPMQKFSLTALPPTVGLYVHKSVIARLEANLQRWRETDDLFMADYGFGAPAPLKDAATKLVEFCKTYDDPASAYAGVIFLA